MEAVELATSSSPPSSPSVYSPSWSVKKLPAHSCPGYRRTSGASVQYSAGKRFPDCGVGDSEARSLPGEAAGDPEAGSFPGEAAGDLEARALSGEATGVATGDPFSGHFELSMVGKSKRRWKKRV